MSHLAVLVLVVLLALAGRTLPLRRWTLRWMAGAVLFHLLLTAYDFVGIPWTRISVLVPLLGLAFLGWRAEREPSSSLPSDLGWGDGAALFALAAFGFLASTLWITTPDFIYHWGIKGNRFFLTHGVDYAWLAREWNWVLHPDYPNLVPELFAGSALLAGRFDAPAQMLWSTLCFGLLLAAGRETLKTTPRWWAQSGLAAVALPLAGFGLGQRIAGGADWMPALALVAAMPALLRPADREGDVEVGIAAAFAAASKIEGMPLAAFLVAVHLARRRPDLRGMLWLVLPTAAVAIPWAARTFGHGLYQKFNSGSFDPSRAPVILRGLVDATTGANWHGLPAVLLTLPLLLLVRRTRPVAAVAGLQLLFYLWIYFSAPLDTGFQVISSFPRLAMHLVPAVILAGVVGLAGLGEGREPVDP